MREILFRGKDVCGRWFEGGYYENNTGKYILSPALVAHLVIPETVCQFTGLTDKNGRKIFEGDIIRLTDEHNEIEWTAVVVFGNPNGEYNWGWQLKAIGEFDGNKDILLWVDMEESGAYCEIIGNIYDNPELLNPVAKDVAESAAQQVIMPAT